MGDDSVNRGLSSGAIALVEMAVEVAEPNLGDVCVRHWLHAVFTRNGPMAEQLSRGVDAARELKSIARDLAAGEPGEPASADEVVRLAIDHAKARGAARASEIDVISVVLNRAGYPLTTGSAETAGVLSSGGSRRGPVFLGTPVLDELGVDLTTEARNGKLRAVVGREAELDAVMIALCRQTKANPALVGPAGVGKTAIAEGLAQRIAQGQAPEPLLGARVVMLASFSILAASRDSAEFSRKVQSIVEEASQPGLILFIDEAHTIMSIGALADQLKPALARGQVSCMIATTDGEYRRFIEEDAALERRFQPVRINEPNLEQTTAIVRARRDALAGSRGVAVDDSMVDHLILLAGRQMQNRFFPDKALDVLEQCVAEAIVRGVPAVTKDFADRVVSGMVGTPVDATDRYAALQGVLVERGVLGPDESEDLAVKLGIAMRSLDLHPVRPNAAVLLCGAAARQAQPLAKAVCDVLYGGQERIITIDFAAFYHPESLSGLIGTQPGYVGFNQALPIHALKQTPACVIVAENLDRAASSITGFWLSAMERGSFIDGPGRQLFLSDAIVIATAQVDEGGEAREESMGFRRRAPDAGRRGVASPSEVLGVACDALFDVVAWSVPEPSGTGGDDSLKDYLSGLAERYRRSGLEIQYEATLVEWLRAASGSGDAEGLEHLHEEHIAPVLLPLLRSGAPGQIAVALGLDAGKVVVRPA